MSSKRILIVEDDIAIRDTLKVVIEEEMMYQVLLALDAETALDMLQAVAPDLFLLDYRLPGMNGVQLIWHIRAIKTHKQTPIILMSACLFWESVNGVRFLRKPFDLDVFLQVVEECLV
jgi:DNA-binding response OmpR family regulator